jgi:hypothetical protein
MKQCVLWVVLGTSSAAFAQPIVEPVAATSPGFVTTDRMDATSRVGGELSYLFLSGNADGTAWRFDLHGQYVDPNTGFGGYASIPFTLATGGGDSNTGGGDLEVGGFFIPKLATPGFSIVIRAGLTLPTASRDEGSSLVNSIVGAGSRPSDLYQMIPRGTSLRLSLSPIVRSGNVFARADIGIDKNLDADGNAEIDAFLRLNAAVGIDLGNAAIMAELVNIHTFGNVQDSWIDQLSFATRLRMPTVEPYAALGFPLNRATRSDIDAALTVGIEGKL